jgi:DHA2 family multidrug resistance protein
MVILPGALASAFTMAAMARSAGRFDPRITVTLGVLMFAFAMWEWSHFTTQSGQDQFFWPLITRGVGLGLVFVPLTNLAMSELPMTSIPAGTGLFNLMRQLGGSVGIALSATLLPHLTGHHRETLAERVSWFEPVARDRLMALASGFIARGATPEIAQSRAIQVVQRQVEGQALMLSFTQIFLLFGLAFVAALPLLALMRYRPGVRGGGMAH